MISAPIIRRLLNAVLRTDSDLTAFCVDHFPEVEQRFTLGMDRIQKVTILLQCVDDPQRIFDALVTDHPKAVETARRLVSTAGPVSASATERMARPSSTDALEGSREAPSAMGGSGETQRLNASRRLQLQRDRRPLHCDFETQWDELCASLPLRRRSEIALLPGARGQAHEYFVRRVQADLPRDPQRRVVRVEWHTHPFPKLRSDFLDALADSLKCAKEYLPNALREHLKHRNLFLLHPCVRDGFEDRALVQYYTEWLPQVLAQVDAPHHLICLQPIEWLRCGFVQRWLALFVKALWPRQLPWMHLALHEKSARKLIRTLAQQSTQLPVQVLDELSDITRVHLGKFCKKIGMPNSEKEHFINLVMAGAHSSTDILEALGQRLAEREI